MSHPSVSRPEKAILNRVNNQSFLENFEKVNWNEVLQLNQDNVNITFENCLNTVNTSINSYAPSKKLNKKQRKFQKKPGITKGIQNAIEKKNRLSKSTLDVLIVIKTFYIKNIKHIETAYQLY